MDSPPLYDYRFQCGNPAVQLIPGVVRLYGPIESKAQETSDSSEQFSSSATNSDYKGFPTDTLVVFAVPSFLPLSEFYSFTESWTDSMTHLQIVSALSRMGNKSSSASAKQDTTTSSMDNMTVVQFPNSYTVLLKFCSQDAARSFQQSVHGHRFNSLEKELCLVEYVHSVQFFDKHGRLCFPSSEGGSFVSHIISTQLSISSDHATPTATVSSCSASSSSSSSSFSSFSTATVVANYGPSSSSSSSSTTPLSSSSSSSTSTLDLSISSVSSLMKQANSLPNNNTGSCSISPITSASICHAPSLSSSSAIVVGPPSTCTVCLEPIQPSKKAMLTILCLHSFHFICLSRWACSMCPLCRYVIHPALSSECSECGATQNLWICLICGHIGCSRYDAGHAEKHFQETNHSYSLDVTHQKVWDYVSDGYVHRLVLERRSNKLVQLGADQDSSAVSSTSSSKWMSPFDKHASLKMEQILTEYNYLLSTQLEKQCHFFKQQLKCLDHESENKANVLRKRIASIVSEHSLLQSRQSDLARQLLETQQSLSLAQNQLRCVSDKQARLKKLNQSLSTQNSERIERLKQTEKQVLLEKEEDIKQKDEVIEQLSSELRDLQFHLKVAKTVDKSSLSGGRVFLGQETGEQTFFSAKAKLKKRIRKFKGVKDG